MIKPLLDLGVMIVVFGLGLLRLFTWPARCADRLLSKWMAHLLDLL